MPSESDDDKSRSPLVSRQACVVYPHMYAHAGLIK